MISNFGKVKLDLTMHSLSTVSTLSSKFYGITVLTISVIREEGLEGKPAYITIALHTRWIGRPGRFVALKKMIDHFTSHDDVWFATREQIARHWAKTYPYQPKE
jgi:peptidoglycan/xylan/chitin deacetylase (PgdA/CDA1 family)